MSPDNAGRILTDHVIAILIRDQGLKRALALFVDRRHSSNDSLPFLLRARFYAVLYDIASKLVLREIDQLRSHKGNGPASVLLQAMFNDVLHHIIAVLVDN